MNESNVLCLDGSDFWAQPQAWQNFVLACPVTSTTDYDSKWKWIEDQLRRWGAVKQNREIVFESAEGLTAWTLAYG